MTIDLKGPLGSYSSYDEFQVDRTLIWIKISPHGERESWLTQGKFLFDEIWAAVPEALRIAEQVSRNLCSDFWDRCDSKQASGQPLAVWGIWINPETGNASYDININHHFQSDHDDLPDLPEESIGVIRNREGRLKIEA